ncbi:PaaI family thioesterase [Legionella sp. CNM-4043-24]|uniref:PaaI family thioesterase n=1 Tax=Legionella sp. CNM-4043-24 TaxID=3421646 RepID=UPI00403AE449
MSVFTRFRFFLWYFGHFQVPLIGHLRPRLITLNDQVIVIRLPLRRRSRNHFKSMYFGALAVGADLAGGLHGFYHARQAGLNPSLVFKSFQAQFLKRPESDVYFVCEQGDAVKAMLDESKKTGLRINRQLPIKAYTHFVSLAEPGELVADFLLELSIKVQA